MRAELVRLRAAFPEFSFGICPGWRGPMFEVWRETGTSGLSGELFLDTPPDVQRYRDAHAAMLCVALDQVASLDLS